MFDHTSYSGPGFWLSSGSAYTSKEISLIDDLQKTLTDATNARTRDSLYVRKEDLDLKIKDILAKHNYSAKWKRGIVEEMITEIMKQVSEPPKEEVKIARWCYV